jgi:hypothetical protein
MLGSVELVTATAALEQTVNLGNVTSNTVQFTNATTGLVATGNVEASKFIGDGSLLTGITTIESNVDLTLNTNNTAFINLNSNVVVEFPRSKKLIKYPRVALTSASDNAYENGYKVTHSNQHSSYKAWEAFDHTGDVIGWYSTEGAAVAYNGTTRPGLYSGNTRLATETEEGEWIGLELPEAIKLQSVRMTSQSYSSTGNAVDEFIIYAKKQSGDVWTSLGLFTGVAGAQNSAAGVTVNVDAIDYYKFFNLVVTKRHDVATPNLYGIAIRELEYYGTPEYDPEAHGTDVTVKSVPNVPNTDWLEVYYDAKNYTSGVVQDESLNSYVGTLNSVTLDNSAIQSFDIPDGGNISATLTSIPSADFVHSVSVWVKFEGDTLTTSYPYLYFMGATSNYSGFGLFCAGAARPNQLHVSCWTLDYPINFTFYNDTWHHVTYTYSGGGWSRNSTLNAYVDGIEYGFGTNWSSGTEGTTPTIATSNVPLRLGTTSTGGVFDGKIANFRLFNRALTSVEAYQLYAYQKEYFGHGDLSMTLKAGRLGIGTSEPKATLDIRGEVLINGYQLTSMYPGFASGGDDVYDIDGYRIHVFTTSGTFVVPGTNISADVLAVGGGGGGGQDNAGGAGAGGLIFKPGHTFEGRGASTGRDGAYTIVIGSGGTGSTYQNSDAPDPGGDTYIRPLTWKSQSSTYGSTAITQGTFTNIFTAKGGGPGNNGGTAAASTLNGGSGGGQDAEIRTGQGGGVATQPTQSGDSGTYGYGNNGGNSASEAGGGGGGAGKVGESAGSGATLGLYYGGYGGDGLSGVSGYDFAEIFGTKYGEVVGEDVYFAGGGAGANKNTPSSGFTSANGYALGGKGGGGSAGGTPETNEAGLPGTGGGGAGATWVTNPTYYNNLDGGNGGSGIVMIRYRL